jgi:Replication factor-A protein 1, N-terminal domain
MISQCRLRDIFFTYITNPVFQCLQVKDLADADAAAVQGQFYRVLLSDTYSSVQCILGSMQNRLVVEGKLQRGALVRLKAYRPGFVREIAVLILFDVEVLGGFGDLEVIGDPCPVPMSRLPPFDVEDGDESGGGIDWLTWSDACRTSLDKIPSTNVQRILYKT